MSLLPDQPRVFDGTLSVEQTKALLLPINPRRVLQTQGQSYVPAHEVIAHLIRLFGFGNFNFEFVEPPECIFESVRPPAGAIKADEPWKHRYDVCYRAAMRLTIFDKDHNVVAWYEDGATGDASNSTRADAHDLALKSAISTAKKRCAIHLGDQFGLSLYNKGSLEAQVLKTKVAPKSLLDQMWPSVGGVEIPDPSEGIAQQTGMGIDEIEKGGVATEDQEAALAASTGSRPNFQRGHQQDEPHSPEDDLSPSAAHDDRTRG